MGGDGGDLGLGVVVLFTSSYLPSVSAILQASILAIGVQISFHMILAGYACAWHYREMLTGGGARDAITHVIWLFPGAAFMVFIGLYSIPTFDNITLAIGLLALGVVPLARMRQRTV